MADAEGINAHSYEVLGKLADGGTTEIFLARARGTGAVERFVVLKRLRRSVAGQLDVVKVFLDEAQRASQLQHPNVAQVFEVGKLGGSYFFAMEFVNGETLEALIRHARDRKIQVPVRAVLTIASAMAAGLHHAHERRGTDGQPLGILHGDVSPANTLVSQEGIVKLVDFGLAKAGEQGASTITPYASPEQCSGDALDRRSDLFSLGVVLWELLTLDALRPRGGETEIWQAIETEEPAKPSAKRYDVPPELDAMVLKLLAKDPADRFQDADELLAAIETLAQKLGILLSTADLSRMVRLWFGTKSEPTVDPSSPEAAAPLVITSEQVPAELAEPSSSPIDDALDAVRSAATLITARATARAGNTTGRQDRPTVPPELMDNPNENFEQIRDRILARARQKKETLRNQIIAAGGTPPDAAAPPVDNAAAPAPDAASSSGSDRHTRTTVQAPLTTIEAAVRRAGLAEPFEPSATASGILTGSINGTSREAPPATENLAKPASELGTATVSGTIDGATNGVRRAGNGVHEGRAADASASASGHDDVAAPSSAAASDDAAARVTDTADQPARDMAANASTGNGAASASTANGAASASTGAASASTANSSTAEEAANASTANGAASASTANGAASASTGAASASTANASTANGAASASTANASTASGAASTGAASASTASEAATASAASANTANGASSASTADDAATGKAARTSTSDEPAARKAARTSTSDEPTTRKAARTSTADEPATRNGARTSRSDAATRKTARAESAHEEAERERAYARASTAEIAYGRRNRPSWIIPAIGVGAAFAVLIVTIKLHGGDNASEASATTPQTSASHSDAPRSARGTEPGPSGQALASGTSSDVGSVTGTGQATGAATGATATTATGAGPETSGTAASATAGTGSTSTSPTAVAGASAGTARDATKATATDTTKSTTSEAAKSPTSDATKSSTSDATKVTTSDTTMSTTSDAAARTDHRVASDESSARENAANSGARTVRKADKPAETNKEPELGIEELYAAGEYAKTNVACTKAVVFSADKLQKCALSACQTKNTALATRWVRAISKSARPEIIESCRGMGVDLEPAEPASPAPSPAPAEPSPPPAEPPPAP